VKVTERKVFILGVSYTHVLMATTPEDGRYAPVTKQLDRYVSEFGLMQRRVRAEVVYLTLLSQHGLIRPLTSKELHILTNIHRQMKLKDAIVIKDIETGANAEVLAKKGLKAGTKHDVMAMIDWFKFKLRQNGMSDLEEKVHYMLTSEDVNNVAYRLQLLDACREVIFPKLKEILLSLAATSEKHIALPMLGRTHGQPAVTTTFGKEYANFLSRLFREYQKLIACPLTGKMNGAVGNYNAHHFLEEDVNWVQFSEEYAGALGLKPSLYTTQINPPEDIIEFLQILQRINNILIDFAQDNWRYISDDWIGQKRKESEVGSSTMAQKVNPIDFENAEGNFGKANALIGFLVEKLPKSRLQRDLSDSTVMREIGPILDKILIGLEKIKTGLSRTFPNEFVMSEYLNKN